MIPRMFGTAFFVICFAQVKFSVGDIAFRNNGYENIDVAIGANVPEDHSLVYKIMKMFEEGSDVLFEATYGKAYFRKVNIWIPPSWKYRDNNVTTRRQPNWYDDAHVLIENEDHPIYGHNPFTLQPGGCGEPGVYIYFTTNVLNSTAYGPHGRVLVHEWAHFRYGVFNEYVEPFSRDFYYYDENREVRPTVCPSNIKGYFRNEKEFCSQNADGAYSRRCVFVPDTKTNANENITVSLMALPYLKNVKYFCNDSEHNMLAPTKHNAKCNKSSTWAVISAHPDFREQTLEPESKENKRPEFTLYQSAKPETKYVVLLVDLSESMNGKLKTVATSLKNFIKFRMPKTTEVAIMGFSSIFENNSDAEKTFNYTKLFKNLTVVGNKTEEILASIDKLADHNETQWGKRPIGQALNSTLKFLRKQRRKTTDASVLLITDGPTNYLQVAGDMLKDLMQNSLEVNVVALGSLVRPELRRFAKLTMGADYTINTEQDGQTPKLHDLDSALFDYANKISSSYSTILFGRTFSLQSGEPITKTFSSEIPSGKYKLDVYVCSAEKTVFNLTIWTEEEVVYYNQSDCHFTSFQPSGKFNYSLSYVSNTHENTTALSVIISVRSLEMHTAPMADIRHRKILPDLNAISKIPLVHVILTKGRYTPIIQAEVNLAYCNDAESSVSCEIITLEDNGVDPDNFAHDGVYTGFLGTLETNTTYTNFFQISKGKAIERGNSARITKSGAPPIFNEDHYQYLPKLTDGHDDGNSVYDSDRKDPDICEQYVCTDIGDFYREVTSPSFQLSYMKPDSIPPALVSDLRATSVGLSARKAMHLEVDLEWTAVGDDFYKGTADAIELRYASTPRIFYDFYHGNVLNMSHVIRGKLIPQAPGTTHSITVEVLAEHYTYPKDMLLTYFVVQTCDENRQCSTSGPAYAKLHMITSVNNVLGISTGTLTLMAVFGTVFVVVVGIVILKIIHCVQNNAEKKDNGEDFESNTYASKGNTYSNYSNVCSKDVSAKEAANQAAELGRITAQSAQT